MIHNISYYKVRVSTGGVETRWMGGIFLMVYRYNAGRLGSRFISVCLEIHWLGHLGGFYVPERPCTYEYINMYICIYIYVCIYIYIYIYGVKPAKMAEK